MDSSISMRRTRRRRLAPLAVAAALVMAPTLGTGQASAEQHHPAVRGITLIRVPDCTAFIGAKELGAKIQAGDETVYACGPRPSYSRGLSGVVNVLATVFPYHLSIARYPGYQCVELTARYLAAAYGARTGAGTVNGAQVVDNYARRYPGLFRTFKNGNRAHPPKHGDVISFSKNRHFSDVGHAGVVLWSKLGKKGNGHVKVLEQNYGGSSGAHGWHRYKVKHFKVVWKQKPYIEWLHRRGT